MKFVVCGMRLSEKHSASAPAALVCWLGLPEGVELSGRKVVCRAEEGGGVAGTVGPPEGRAVCYECLLISGVGERERTVRRWVPVARRSTGLHHIVRDHTFEWPSMEPGGWGSGCPPPVSERERGVVPGGLGEELADVRRAGFQVLCEGDVGVVRVPPCDLETASNLRADEIGYPCGVMVGPPQCAVGGVRRPGDYGAVGLIVLGRARRGCVEVRQAIRACGGGGAVRAG